MSKLGDILWNQYGGDAPSDPQAVALAAIQRYGSGRAAARALDVDEKTIRRWKNGVTSKSETASKYAVDARRTRAEARTGPIEVDYRYAGRDRRLKFGEGGGGARGLDADASDRIADAYASGDREQMAREFIDGISDPWYQRKLERSYEDDLRGEEVSAGEDSSAPGVFVA